MDELNALDYSVIGFYVCGLIAMGLYLKRRAAASLDDYFLGGRNLPWWALGASGMASFLDMAGTMVIVSFLFMLGPRGLFIEFRGGAVLVLVFMLLWTGKWHRRSGCMTNAEWQIYRFGAGPCGHFARMVTAFAQTVFTVFMLAYLVKGGGPFLATFLPFTPTQCALGMVIIATIYTMTSGFYGVVFTDIFQSIFILVAVIGVSAMAISEVSNSPEPLAVVAERVTENPAWTDTMPSAHAEMPPGYTEYSALLMFAAFYLLRNIWGGLGEGGDPKYFGARSDRECGLLTFMWTWLMMVRWPMMMGFAVMGIFLVDGLFPQRQALKHAEQEIKRAMVEPRAAGVTLDFDGDQAAEAVLPKAKWLDVGKKLVADPNVNAELADKLKGALGEGWQQRFSELIAQHELIDAHFPKKDWRDQLSTIANKPEAYPKLVAQLEQEDVLGNEWARKLHLLSYNGTVDPEGILPSVILYKIHAGFRGLLLIALIAAAMSTFDSQVNKATAFFTRDILQGYIKRDATTRQLMLATYVYGVVLVACGFSIALFVKNINDIWGWIVMALGGALAVPTTLRFYWWRFNAGGVIAGTIVGLVAPIVQRLIHPDLDERWQFAICTGSALIAAIIGTYLSPPTHKNVLHNFYRTTRPFGIWGRFKRELPADERDAVTREHVRDICCVPFVFGWQVCLFLLPMQAVIGAWSTFWPTLGVFLFCLTMMYFLWYRNLPAPGQEGIPFEPFSYERIRDLERGAVEA